MARIEFQVSFVTFGQGTAIAVGRCCVGPVSAGSVLHSLEGRRFFPHDDKIGRRPEVAPTVVRVNLHIEQLALYSQPFASLDPGMTGGLLLRGEGLDALQNVRSKALVWTLVGEREDAP